MGVITSIGPQHLETFFNMENIVSTKYELGDALPEGGMLFLNGDNEYVSGNADKYKTKTFYRVNSEGEGYHAENIKLTQTGTDFTVVAPSGEKENYHMKLVGAHNVINVVGATAVANTLGVKLSDLIIPVRRILPVAHRLELLERGNVTIIDDAYNSNPVGSKAAVETLNMFDGVRILVTPGMVELGDKEEEYNYKFGTYAAANCDYVLLVGAKHTEPIKKGVLDSGFDENKCKVYDTLQEALAYAYTIKDEGHKFILLENDLTDNY
jgi:UDP-N-acetylmuramoyl-tripeptide--D-alanyl-D-alanine ligase